MGNEWIWTCCYFGQSFEPVQIHLAFLRRVVDRADPEIPQPINHDMVGLDVSQTTGTAEQTSFGFKLACTS